MYSKWNSQKFYPPSAPKMHTGQSSQQMNQRLKNLEDQMELLIKLMECNNKPLRSIEEQKNRVCTAGGGSVIVRM
ncbi:hypothetical protein ABE057_16385 [Bacillus paralicheniformis]|uniref:hypothetical protein n=1 Tax=Bacillus paralicheniformis TaxID=1648923 RepID=UPI003D1F8A44